MAVPDSGFQIRGWVEQDGRRLSDADITAALSRDPLAASRFGGEFFLRWNGCMARDRFGVIPGNCPAGSIVCEGKQIGSVNPDPEPRDIENAIITAVQLRSDEGITALSGGVDSALVAKLSGRECVAVGLPGSHDLRRAAQVAKELHLSCECVEIAPEEVEPVLRHVITKIPAVDPVNASIATTQYFIARWAGEQGHRRILTGQGADELFGGYARYLESEDLAAEMERDFLGLADQANRDQAVAALHGTYLSQPYLDVRVVRAVRAVPHRDRLNGTIRKYLLRSIAEWHIPHEIAWYDKKAMQYGSGIMKVIRDLARKNGYSRSLQGYLDYLRRAPHGE